MNKKIVITFIVILLGAIGYFVYQKLQPEAETQPAGTNKIYTVDELVKSNIKEWTEVLVRGRYNVKLISAGSDYEGPGSGNYLFGETESIFIGDTELKNVALNQIITVKGKVDYCGGKKTPKYICALTESELVPETAKIYSIDELMNSNLPENTLVKVRAKNSECQGINFKVSEDYEGAGSGIYLNGSIKIEGKEIEEICSSKYKDKEFVLSGYIGYCGGKKIPKYICRLSDVKIEEVID